MDRRRKILPRYAWMYNGASYLQRTNPTGLDLNGAELLANPTFDAGVSNWGAAAGITLAYETVVKRTGAGSAKMTSDGTANGTIISAAIANTSTNKFTCEFWAYIPASSTGKKVNILVVDQSNAAIFAGSDITLTADTWTRLVLNGQAVGAQTQIKARIRYVNPSVGDILYVDDASLTQQLSAICFVGARTISSGTVKGIFGCGQGLTTTVGRVFFAKGSDDKLRITIADNELRTVTDQGNGSAINDGRLHFYAFVIDAGWVIKTFKDGVAISAGTSIATLGKLTGIIEMGVGDFGSNTATWDDIITPLQLVYFNFLPADGGVSIIADTYNRFKANKPFAKSYSGGTIALDLDPKNNGRDTSAYANHLTPAGTPPPGIIRI